MKGYEAMSYRLRLSTFLVTVSGVLLPDPALAYIGPGAGLGAIALTIALVLGLLLLLVGLLWYPLKRLLKRKTRAAARDDRTDGSE